MVPDRRGAAAGEHAFRLGKHKHKGARGVWWALACEMVRRELEVEGWRWSNGAKGDGAETQIHVAFEKMPGHASPQLLSSRHPCFALSTRDGLVQLQTRIWEHSKGTSEARAMSCDEPGGANSGSKVSGSRSAVFLCCGGRTGKGLGVRLVSGRADAMTEVTMRRARALGLVVWGDAGSLISGPGIPDEVLRYGLRGQPARVLGARRVGVRGPPSRSRTACSRGRDCQKAYGAT